jgi:hypothetical protein
MILTIGFIMVLVGGGLVNWALRHRTHAYETAVGGLGMAIGGVGLSLMIISVGIFAWTHMP